MIRKTLSVVLASSLLIGTPLIVGCDRTVEEKKTVKTSSDGTTEVDKKKITESPDGTIKKTEEHTVDK